MKLLKLLPFALFALALTACGDDEDDNYTDVTGTFTTNVYGKTYAEDKVHADVSLNTSEGYLSIGIDQVTAQPASGEKPAKVLKNFSLRQISYTEVDGIYSFEANLDGEHAFGYIDGDEKQCAKCHIMGTLEGKKLFFTMEFKFTNNSMEPLLSSTYTGTCMLTKK